MVGKKETVYAMVFSVLSKLTTYFLLIVLANLFVKEAYGRASFVMNIFQIILLFNLFGVPYILVPWILKKKDSSSVFYFLTFISFLMTTLGLILTWNHKWIMPLVILFPFLLIRGFSTAILYAKYKYNIVSFFDFVYMIFSFIFIFLLHSYGKSGIILGYTFAFLLHSLILIFLTRKDLAVLFKKFRFDFYVVKEYINYALATSLLVVSFNFLSWVDSSILGLLSTFENVAMYNVAGPLTNIITLIPVAIGLFLLTKTSEITDELEARKILLNVLRISFSFSLLLAIMLVSFSSLILSIFFPKYLGIEPFIAILSAGIVFFSLYHLIYSYMLGRLEPKKALFAIGFAALLNIFLDILLIPYFGLYGICFATLFAHIFAYTVLAFKNRLIKKFFGVYFLIGFIFLAYYMKIYGLILILILVPLLFLFRLLRKEDILLIYDVIRSMINTPKFFQNRLE